MKKNNSLKTLTSHKSDEHNTPSYIIEAAREVLEVIDLDPMSNALANETVKATTFYTKKDDELDKDWYGRVWLNQPFSFAKLSITKLIKSYKLVLEVLHRYSKITEITFEGEKPNE